MNIRALLESERLAVVEIERAIRGAGVGEYDDEGERIPLHQAAALAGAVAAGDDMPTLHEEGDFGELRGDGMGFASAEDDAVVKVVEVFLTIGDVDVNAHDAFSGNRLDEETGGADIELVVKGEAFFIGRVDVVVWTDDGGACRGGFAEGSVPGRQKLVA